MLSRDEPWGATAELLRGLTYIWAVETERIETPYGTFACLKGDFITANLRKFRAHPRSDLAAALLGLDEWSDSSPSAPQSTDLLKIDVEGMELRRGQATTAGGRIAE